MLNIDYLEGLCTTLRDNNAAQRRRSIKEILEIIGKDSNRFLISAMGEGKQNMWVRLTRNAKLAVDKEVAAADKRGRNPRNDEADFLLKIVRLAAKDDKTRQLGPVVAELLAHVVTVLEDDFSREAYGKVYTQVLCTILEEPEFCEQISPKLFENTTHTLLRVLRMSQDTWDARQQRGVAAYARSLQLLLSGYGKDIHEFLEPLVEFFSGWCASMDRGCDRGSTAALKVVSSVFEALKTLLQLYGTACAPMLRQSGREVLDFILRRFSSAQRIQRGYMVEYLRLHLRVAGAARSARGEHDPIFDAIPNLYSLLVNEQEIAGAVGSAALHRIGSGGVSGGGGGSGSGSRRRGGPGVWLSLERRGRAYLLLCADLVRFFREEMEMSAFDRSSEPRVEEHEWNDGVDDSCVDDAAGVGRDRGNGKRKARHCRSADDGGHGRAESLPAAGGRAVTSSARKRSRATDPWEDILGALFNEQQAPLPFGAGGGRTILSSASSGGGSGRRSPSNASGVFRGSRSAGGSGRGGRGIGKSGAVASSKVATNPVHSLPWLQLLAAVLEAYPAGGCWRSKDTATELARVVLAADAQLRSTPDPSVHLWALVCLLRAAEASKSHLSRQSLARRNSYGVGDAAEALGVAWRTAWATLLRADQRFCSPTGRCERSGVGEAVVAVLGACMREGLVEPGFVTKEQDRLWALPLFRSPANASCSTEPFRLVTAFLRRGDLLEGQDNICIHMQTHQGPGAMAPDSATPTTSAELNSSDSGPDPEEAPSAVAAVSARSRRNKGCRQNRRRWRLLQYVLGWMEMSTLEAGGGGSGGGCSWTEAEEAWAAAADALVAITCSGPPPGTAATAAAGIVTNAPGVCRRPFLIEISVPPCPFLGTAVATTAAAGSLGPAAGADLVLEEGLPGDRWGGAIADGVWMGVLDDLGPFLRQGGGGMKPIGGRGRRMSRGGRLSVGSASAVWSCEGMGMQEGHGWGEVDLPAYVNFMSLTLRDCEPRPESLSSPIAPPGRVTAVEDASSTVCGDGRANLKGCGEGGGGGEGGGSNMVSRDDTAAMHRLIGRWLRREAEELANRAAECAACSSAERMKILRALMHCVCVLATFFRHACEAGVEHPELESALWAAISAAAGALEHAARQTDYRTVCEGLARLHRVVVSLLDWAARSVDGPQTDQSDAMDGSGGRGSASTLTDILRFCSRLVKDWHKGNLPETAPPPNFTAAAASGRPGYRSGSSGISSKSGTGNRSARSRPTLALSNARDTPTQGMGGGFSADEDDMMNDDDSGSWGGGGGGEGAGVLDGGLDFVASQYSPTQVGGGGGAGGGVGSGGGGGCRGGNPGNEARLFGEGKGPGGALKGAAMWCARLSLVIGPSRASARRLSQYFEKAYKDAAVDEAELFAVALEAAQAYRSAGEEIGVNGDTTAEDLAGVLSLVRSAVDLVLAYADPDDRSSDWLLRLLGAIQQVVAARGHRRGSPHLLAPVPPIPTPLSGSRGNRSGSVVGASGEGDQECLARLANAVFKDKLLLVGAKNSRLVRAARISAARAVFDVCPDSTLRDDFAACIFAGTTDPDAGVRSAAVGATRVLFRRFLPARHSAIFATLLSQLPPVVVSDEEVEVSLGDGDSEEKSVAEPEVVSASEQAFARLSKGKLENVQRYFVTVRRELEATSLVTVADMAVSSDRVTRAALYHLLRRSVRPELAAAIRRLMERLARVLGFTCGPALLREHLVFFMAEWMKERSSLEGFPFELLGHGRGGGSALRACAHVAVPLAVVQLSRKHRLREVQSMAEELGMGATDTGVARLIRLYMADIKAVYLPLLYTEGKGVDEGVEADRRVASEADDFLQRVIAEDKAGKASDNLQTLVLRLLDMGVVEPFGMFGRVTLKSISDTLEQVAGQLENGPGKKRSGGVVNGVGNLLRKVNFVEVVLHVRRHIARARGPEAQRRVFGVLEFVVTEAAVEEDASCLWATITVLLWLLETRTSELVATASTRTPEATHAGKGDGSGGDGDGVEDGGAASAVRLMSDVFGRCMSCSKGQKLLGKHFGAVVEGLVGVFVDLREAQARLSSTRNPQVRGFANQTSPAEEIVSDEDDEEDFEITPMRSSVAGRSSSDRRRTKQDKDGKGGCAGGGCAQEGSRVVKRPGSGDGCERDGGECGRVADLVLDLLKALIVDSPASMSSFVARLHPFPDGTAAFADLETLSHALAEARRSEADAATSRGRVSSGGGGADPTAMDADGTREVWQAAERLVDASSGEGGSPLSPSMSSPSSSSSSSSSPSSSSSTPSRTAGSLLAILSHMRRALRRCTGGGKNCDSGGVDSGGVGKVRGAWEVMSSGPKGAVLARAAVGAVVRICRSERPAAVHVEASRLAGEIGAVDPYDVELAERASARGGGRLEGLGADSSSKDASGSLGDPLACPKLRALRMTATYLTDRDADLSSCALFTAKALLSRGGANDHLLVLLKASSSEVQALLEPFTARLAQMNTARMSASVWSGLFGKASAGGWGNEEIGVPGKAGNGGSAMSAEVWTTAGKTFPQWVCGLTSALLLECYAGAAFRCFKNASSEDPTFPSRPPAVRYQGARPPLEGQDEILALFYALSRRKAELAACLLPAIIYDLVRSHDDPDDVDNGEGDGEGGSESANRAAAELSAAFREHVFCLDGPPRLEVEGAGAARRLNPQVVALGIEVLNFLRGRQVAAFLRHHQQGKRSRKSTTTSGGATAAEHSSRWLGWAGEGRGNDGGSGLPFGYYLDLDPLGVARAAAHCGAHCSALFYAEAWIEGEFGEAAGIAASRWRDQGELSGGDGLDGSSDSYARGDEEWESEGDMETPSRRRRGRGEGKVKEKRQVERLLLEVFSSLPEPDSIYGVPAPAADLTAQAAVYAHEGGWENTLPSYDTLLQQQRLGPSGAAAVTGSLSDNFGLLLGSGLQTGIAASLQRMGLRHVLEYYLRGLRVGAESVRDLPDLDGDLREMQFESAWRLCEWDPSLVATFANGPAGGAEVNGASSSTLFAGDARSRIPSAGFAVSGTSYGGGVDDVVGNGGHGGRHPVFHEHILQALGSLRQRNATVFGSAVGSARSHALSRLRSGGGGQEGGKGLYPCLVQLQCVAELEEAFSVLSLIAGAEGEGDNGVDDAAEVLMERWRARSVPVEEHFESLEPLLALREAMVRVLHHERPGRRSRRLVLRHLLDVSQSARRVGHHSIAQGALHRFLQVSRARLRQGGGVGAPRAEDRAAEAMRCRLAEARVLWGKGETDGALRAARAVATRLKAGVGATDSDGGGGDVVDRHEQEEQRLLSEALCLTGAWMSKTKSESSREILQSYLNPAVNAALAGGGAALIPSTVVKTPRSSGAGGDSEDEDGFGSGGWGDEGPRRLLCAAHFTLAEYLAGLYVSVRGRVESSEWRAAGKVSENRARELASCKKKLSDIKRKGQLALGVNPDHTNLYRYAAVLEKEEKLDKNERAGVEQSVGTFLTGALQNYGKALAASREPDLRAVFTVVSLWFNNKSNPDVNNAMQLITRTVPSYKFIPLTYQISSRVGSGDGAQFLAGVHRLILLLCREHPHHSLLQLLALANGENVSGHGSTQFKQNVSTEKIQAAKGLLHELKGLGRGSELSSSLPPAATVFDLGGPGPAASAADMPALVSALERLVEAYIELAMTDTSKYHNKKTGGITFSEAVPKGRPTLDRCLRDRGAGAGSRGSGAGAAGKVMPGVVTRPPPVRPDADYRGMPTIAGFQSSFSITDSGIHRPKIVHCLDSSGGRYRQLVKGADDIRQDAVMEQVFATVNSFLREDPAARKRRLRVFTYTIVPLSPDSGVLEWVEDTMPFGSFLTDRGSGKPGAHRRYFPKDWLHAKCRTHMKNAVDKRQAYAEVEDNFHPAFRFFFLENFLEPFTWYNSRLTFTRSAAVSSIVGYVLGIGDRHAHNILVHQRTAEVVHIDFGVTFEQGKALSTPETVPFRLTRDVVDGMGVTGTEGAFRRACETAMRVLRCDAPSVLTILEVLLHDPLYRWMLSPYAARQRQQDEKGDGNGAAVAAAAAAVEEGAAEDASAAAGGDAAQRALARIKHKLQGYEDPNGDAMSVEGQVKLLVNQARDPENLSRLYPGWAPWL